MVRTIMISALLAYAPAARADLVGAFDPPGGAELDQEIGNITEAALEALGPTVNDHENGTGPQAANETFFIGPVQVSGTYGLPGAPPFTANFSGGRTSFTISTTDSSGAPAGTWMYAAVSADNLSNIAVFDFLAPKGDAVAAVGLAWLGRDNRAGDATVSATATFADGTTLDAGPVVADGTGDGLPAGKDVFVGFQDTGGHGGIVSLSVLSTQDVQPFHFFHGWDDIGVVLESAAGGAPVPEPGTLGLVLLAGAGLVLRRRRRR